MPPYIVHDYTVHDYTVHNYHEERVRAGTALQRTNFNPWQKTFPNETPNWHSKKKKKSIHGMSHAYAYVWLAMS